MDVKLAHQVAVVNLVLGLAVHPLFGVLQEVGVAGFNPSYIVAIGVPGVLGLAAATLFYGLGSHRILEPAAGYFPLDLYGVPALQLFVGLQQRLYGLRLVEDDLLKEVPAELLPHQGHDLRLLLNQLLVHPAVLAVEQLYAFPLFPIDQLL